MKVVIIGDGSMSESVKKVEERGLVITGKQQTIFTDPQTNESFSKLPLDKVVNIKTIDKPILSGRENRRQKRKEQRKNFGK